MKNGNLAPTLHPLCLRTQWRGDTRVHRWSLPAFVESIQFICYTSEFSDRAAGAHMHGLVNLHVERSHLVN